MVEDIKKFRAELQIQVLSDPIILEEREIKVHQTRSIDFVPGPIAQQVLAEDIPRRWRLRRAWKRVGSALRDHRRRYIGKREAV